MRAIGFAIIALALAGTVSAAEPEKIVSRIERQPVRSSALAAVGYSKRLRALEVEFLNGAIYRYKNVPPEVFRALMSARSKARFYDTHVRHHFPSVRVKRPPRR